MKSRLVIWALAGLLVAGLWALYAALTFPTPLMAQPMVWTLINLSCPIAFASFHFHFGIKLHWVLLANAATYGLVGLAAESLGRQWSHAGSSKASRPRVGTRSSVGLPSSGSRVQSGRRYPPL